MPTSVKVLAELFLRRIAEQRAKSRLQDVLIAANEKLPEARRIRVTGTHEELAVAVVEAVEEGSLPLEQLATVVDEIEENGGQHIFLFSLSDVGARELTASRITRPFGPEPTNPTLDFYRDRPKVHFVQGVRDNLPVVKRISTAEYWEKNIDESEESADRRVVVFDKRELRACDMLILDVANGTLQIRIDRVRNAMDDRMGVQRLNEFLDGVGVLDIEKHLVPLPLRAALNKIAQARDETYMSVDEAYDELANVKFANIREQTTSDVRDHPDYALGSMACVRRWLNVFWLHQGQKLHTILNVVSFGDGLELAKVYVPAKLKPADLRHVLDRIRYFAYEAP